MYNIAETMMPTVLKLENERKNNDTSDAGRKNYIKSNICYKLFIQCYLIKTCHSSWFGGLLVERRTSVSQILGSIPGQVAAV